MSSMNELFLKVFREKDTLAFERTCVESRDSERETAYVQKLFTLLKNKGIAASVVTSESDLKALPHAPGRTLAIAAQQSFADTAQREGFSVVGVSKAPLAAEVTLPDIYSLYNVLNWFLNTQHLSEQEQHEPLQKITSVILAAGRGTRMGFDKPKVLYPFCGRTALEIMHAKVSSFSERIIVVPSGDGVQEITHCLKEKRLAAEIAVDVNPYGTGGSVVAALDAIKDSETVAIVWGAQIGFPQEALKNLIFFHQNNNADLSIPTKIRKSPYIHLERDERGVIQSVLRDRWNNQMPRYGENEGGAFIVKGSVLRSTLRAMNEAYLAEREKNKGSAKAEGELDLLDFIPALATKKYRVLTASCVLDERKLGFKSKEEAAYHEERIKQGIPY